LKNIIEGNETGKLPPPFRPDLDRIAELGRGFHGGDASLVPIASSGFPNLSPYPHELSDEKVYEAVLGAEGIGITMTPKGVDKYVKTVTPPDPRDFEPIGRMARFLLGRFI